MAERRVALMVFEHRFVREGERVPVKGERTFGGGASCGDPETSAGAENCGRDHACSSNQRVTKLSSERTSDQDARIAPVSIQITREARVDHNLSIISRRRGMHEMQHAIVG